MRISRRSGSNMISAIFIVVVLVVAVITALVLY